MAKAKQATQIVFEDPPLPGRSQRGRWYELLKPLIQHPNRWAKIHTAANPSKAQGTAANLTQRLVLIPNTEDNWSFISRDTDVYAKYMGKKPRARVRRAK